MEDAAAERPENGDPFDALGAEWHRVSPRLATARRGALAAPALLAAAGLGLAGALTGEAFWWGAAALVALGYAWAWWLVGRQVSAWAYAERPDELLVRRGRLWRRIVVVPYGRLQYVDVDAGPLDRRLGLATVQLHTASAHSDGRVPGLEQETAAALRDRLTARGRAQLSGL
jgi:membrane protein YdbS with pleckstrin-like domain